MVMDMFSDPPATATSISSTMMARAASAIVFRPELHLRSSEKPGTVIGKREACTVSRPRLKP